MGLKTRGKVDILFLFLATLLGVQVSVLVAWLANSSARTDRWLEVGDTVSGVPVVGATEGPMPIADGDTTVVLAFRSGCPYCESVVPVWRQWIAENHHRRVIALNPESRRMGKGYVTRHGLEVELTTIDDRYGKSWAHLLVARVPWVFVLDAEGVVLAQGHGSRIQELDMGPGAGASLEEPE